MRRSWRMAIVAVSIASLAFAACGDDDDDEGADDTTTAPTEAPVDDTTTTEPEAAGPVLTVEPSEGLTDGQTVMVSATGFVATERVVLGEASLGVTQCVDMGDATGQDDCNLGGISIVTVDADGNVPPTEFVVAKGPFGGNAVTCDVEAPCIVQIGELVADADRQATGTVVLTFAE